MDIKTFKTVAGNLPADIAILMRGPTGVGKSHLGKAIADEKELPFIDVRLSIMSEGDVGGYPDLEGMKESGIMTMCMPSWFVRACREPVILMLDEMNRALPGVQQSAFQLVLDRPGTVAPNPASWHRLNDSLVHMGYAPSEVAGSRPAGFYAVAQGFVGVEAGIAFTDFVERYELIVSAEDVIDGYDENEERIKSLTNDRMNAVIDKIKVHCSDNTWSAKQAKNVAKFADGLPGEMMVSLWNNISATQQLPNIQKLHKLIGKKIVEAVQASRNL
jgi:hypothetical protein